MAGGTSSATIGALTAFFLIVFGSICLVVVLSLISLYTSDGSDAPFGSVFAFDAIMLKFMFYNETSGQFENGTVSYNADLSRLCTSEYQLLGATNFLGCALYNGRVFAPHNESTNSRRRRATKSGMYYVGEGRVYFSTPCIGGNDINKTDNATQLTDCVSDRLNLCNRIIQRVSGVLTSWSALSSTFTISATNTSGNSSEAQITAIYGVPSNIAVALARNLNLSPGIISSLQSACRYVGQKSTSAIVTELASIISG